MKVLFWGTPEYAAVILEKLIAVGIEVVGVITQPDRKVGRKRLITPPPVKVLAEKHGIEYYQPEKVKNNPAVLEWMDQFEVDFNVVAAYGHILPQVVLGYPAYGSVNVHASLLPAYRGASPIQACLLNGDKATGVTIIQMNEQMDAGGIWSMEEVEIAEDTKVIDLFGSLADLGAEVLVKTLPKIVNKEIALQSQDDQEATYCRKIGRADGEVKWDLLSAKEVWNRFRAFDPWPGLFTFVDGKRVKILDLELTDEDRNDLEIGKFCWVGQSLLVGLKSGVVRINRLQMEGKKPMSAKDFVAAFADFVVKRSK